MNYNPPRAQSGAVEIPHPDIAGMANEEPDSQRAFGWVEALRIALVCLAAIAVRLHLWEPLPRVSVFGLAAVLVGGWPIFKEAPRIF